MRILSVMVCLAVSALAATTAQSQSFCATWQYEPMYYVWPTVCEPCECKPEKEVPYKTETVLQTRIVPRYSLAAGPNGAIYAVDAITGQVYQYLDGEWEKMGNAIK